MSNAGWIWRQVLLWCGQLAAILGLAQGLCWAFGASSEVERWLSAHISSTLFAVLLYFAMLPLYVLLMWDRRGTLERARELAEADDE
jgi:hypothetical protein